MTRILHVTDAMHAGVLFAVTDMARAQAEAPGTAVSLVYTPRSETPDHAAVQELTGPRVRTRPLTDDPRLAVPAMITQLPGIIRRERPDIVHLHSSRTGMVGRLSGLLTGYRRRLVYSPHGFAFERAVSSERMRSVYTGIERMGVRLAPALALCSDSERDLARQRLPHARTAVLSNAVDVQRLQRLVREAPQRAASAPLLVAHVGRISEQKLTGVFGGIARRWHREGPMPAQFQWIGDGDRSLLPPEVEVTGWLEHEDLLQALARADIVLFTTAAEAMPMSLLESQAMGIPTVASDTTGVVDVIEDGVTGILADGQDALYEALAALAQDPERQRAMSTAAVARAEKLFDMPSLASRSFTAYADLGVTVPQNEGTR